MIEFPNDSDGMALQRLADSGVDMDSPVSVEFYVHADSEQRAQAILKALLEAAVGDTAEIVFDEGELEEGEQMTEENREFWPSWTIYVFRRMAPDYYAIVEFQSTLEELANSHGGKSDGWGVNVQ